MGNTEQQNQLDAEDDEMYSAKQSNQQDIISQKSFKSHKSMKSHKVPTGGGVAEKIHTRDFGGLSHVQMGATVHNETNEKSKTIFSGIAGKLEVGKLQRQYSRGGKRSAHSVTKNVDKKLNHRVGEKSMGSMRIDNIE